MDVMELRRRLIAMGANAMIGDFTKYEKQQLLKE